jgi:predicted Zn-dependent protease
VLAILALATLARGQWTAAFVGVAGHSAQPALSGQSLSGCKPPMSGTSTLRERNRQQSEWMTGFELAKQVDQHTKQITDREIIHYLNDIEGQLVEHSKLDGCFVVKVIDDPEPNAYSLPGGFLYLTTGLLRIVGNESQLAAALAHETAHVNARHLTRLEQRRRVWGRLALLAGPVGYAARRYLGPVLTMKMVRDSELDADGRALQYYISAGYDGREFTALLQSASLKPDQRQSLWDRLLDDHPRTSTRIRRLKQASDRISQPQIPAPANPSEFDRVQSRLPLIDANPD